MVNISSLFFKKADILPTKCISFSHKPSSFFNIVRYRKSKINIYIRWLKIHLAQPVSIKA